MVAQGIELGMWIGRGTASPDCVSCVVSHGVRVHVRGDAGLVRACPKMEGGVAAAIRVQQVTVVRPAAGM